MQCLSKEGGLSVTATKCLLTLISSCLCAANENYCFILLLHLFLAVYIFLTGAYLSLWTSSLVVYMNADELKL